VWREPISLMLTGQCRRWGSVPTYCTVPTSVPNYCTIPTVLPAVHCTVLHSTVLQCIVKSALCPTLGPFVHHILVPLRMYLPPLRSALVRMLTASDPAPGSLIDSAPMCSPVATHSVAAWVPGSRKGKRENSGYHASRGRGTAQSGAGCMTSACLCAQLPV
jgi:hypothetical protein